MTRKRGIVACSCWVVVFALNAWSQPGFQDLKAGLKFDKTTYLVGEPIWAEVKVSNPDSVLLTAWLPPGLVMVAGIQMFSSNGKEIPTHCWDARINTPVTLAMPPLKTGFLARVDLSQCFGRDPERVFLPGHYGARSRFTDLDGKQAVSDSTSFEVVAPEGTEKMVYQELLKAKDRSRIDNLLKKNFKSAYAPVLAMKYWGGTSSKGGKRILLRGIEICRDLIAQDPDRIRTAVLVDSLASLSGRVGGDSLAEKNLKEIITRHPESKASEEAGSLLGRMKASSSGSVR